MVIKRMGGKGGNQGVEIHSNSQIFFKKVEFLLARKWKRCHLYSILSSSLDLDQFMSYIMAGVMDWEFRHCFLFVFSSWKS